MDDVCSARGRGPRARESEDVVSPQRVCDVFVANGIGI